MVGVMLYCSACQLFAHDALVHHGILGVVAGPVHVGLYLLGGGAPEASRAGGAGVDTQAGVGALCALCVGCGVCL